MFLPWYVSLALLLVPILIYRFVISPQWKTRFADSYTNIHDFWARQWARIYALRSFVVATAGIVIAALPDLLVQISSLDLSWLPQPWGSTVGTAVAILLFVIRLMAVTPHERPPE